MRFLFLIICLALTHLNSDAQSININEVMSSNMGVIVDPDGDTSDWIELFNSGTIDVNLNGYGLSENKNDPFKWIFPNYSIKPGEYLLVFASDKDRKVLPHFWNTIISQGDDWKYLVPGVEPEANWRLDTFNDSSWNTGKSGFGMGDNDDATTITITKSIFLRKYFTITNLETVKQLVLHMDYDDGFVAFLNGVEIARAQMDGKGNFPSFNAAASGQHEAVMFRGGTPEKFIVSNPTSILKTGENILAIQVHNESTGSSDFSAIPFLSVETTEQPLIPRKVDILNLVNPINYDFHTNFKLSADGESLYLTSDTGVLTDSVEVKPLNSNISYGRSSKDPSLWVLFGVPTPGKINEGAEAMGQTAGKPIFSMPGGVYSNGFKLVISPDDKNDTIYYTLDGSIPTRLSSRVTNEIDITTSKVVKARILNTGMLPGEVVTNSYILYANNKLPVVSISMNQADLTDQNTGIYVNYSMDWEKPCHLELMETAGNKVAEVDAGVRIFGGVTRSLPQKSLAIFCRKKYGDEHIDCKIFSERPYDKYKNIVLRNSGNDWRITMFRDGLNTSLTLGMNLEQQAFRPAIVFLNGEYWGIQNIREKINEHMIAQHNNVDPDSVTILEKDGVVVMGSDADYVTMVNFLKNNSLSTQANYNKILEWIDVNGFIDYFAAQIFLRNHDWPGNNIKFWKTNDESGRFRWIMFDTDHGMGPWNLSPADNTLEFATEPAGPSWPNPPWSTLLLRKLIENKGFRDQFTNRFADLLNSNFRSDNVNKAINLKSESIANEIDNHIKRWAAFTKNDWLLNVQAMRNFATLRPGYVFGHIREKFSFQKQELITVSADSLQGLIKLNSLLLRTYPWKGYYFPDVPITLTAIPKVGYRFVKWTGVTTNSNQPTIQVIPQANLIITAVFEPDCHHYDDVVINEISYNNDADFNPGDWIELFNKGQFDIDISEWKLTDSDPNHQYIFAANTWLKANSHLVVSNELGRMQGVFPTVENLYGPFGFGLSNTQDAVKLYSSEGQLIDEVNYNNLLPWPSAALDELWSIELRNPSADNNNGSNWILSANKGTPGLRNSAYIPTATEQVPVHTTVSGLKQNYPNPFSKGTTIDFQMEKPGKYSLTILDVNSRVLKIMKGDDPISFVHTIYWDGKDGSGREVPPGIYFYRLEINGNTQVKRMVKVN